jgi:hypothetical protein
MNIIGTNPASAMKPVWRRATAIAVGALLFATSLTVYAQTAPASGDWKTNAKNLKLGSNLDRPDGYCIDVVGFGENIRRDLPLMAHNCKAGLHADQVVQHKADGTLVFPAYNACVTAAGVNQTLLDGAAVILRSCGESSAFLETKPFQHFDLTSSGHFKVRNTDLCLAVGKRSGGTFVAGDAWRALMIAECSADNQELVRWKLSEPSRQ